MADAVDTAPVQTGTAVKKRARRRPWQFYNILIHRYLGYLFLGITVVYAVSGLAVNHIDEWNPNYISVKQKVAMAPAADPQNLTAAEGQKLFGQLGITQAFKPGNVFYPEPDKIEILLSEKEKIRIDGQTWQAEYEKTQRRPLLHLFNFLHLNEPKKAWTIYADVYAVALLLIAATGLFMKKGKKGLWGEAGLWTLAGMVIPAIFVWLYYK